MNLYVCVMYNCSAYTFLECVWPNFIHAGETKWHVAKIGMKFKQNQYEIYMKCRWNAYQHTRKYWKTVVLKNYINNASFAFWALEK